MGEAHNHSGHAHGAEAPRVLRQEQEDASTEITEVARGILRLQLPTDFTGLGHVNTYAIEDSRGFTLVDPGLPSDESWAALQDRMRDANIPLARVHTVYITHSHPDHFGGAHRLVESSNADILTSTMFRKWTDLLDLNETPLEPLDPADATEAGTILDAIGSTDEAEMEQAFPEVVFENIDGTKAVAYANIVSVLIEAIKEQQQQIDELKRQINEKINNL